VRILLVGDYPPDPRLGSTKVLIKLQEEFRALGHACDVLLGDDLHGLPRHRTGRWAFAPLAALGAIRRAVRERGRYDVIDVASAEGLWVGSLHRLGLFPGTAIVARSNGLEHINYRRMLDDATAGLTRKPAWRRWFYPAVRLSQVAAAARVADQLIVLNDTDRAFAIARHWKNDTDVSVVPHGVSARFLNRPPVADAPRGRGILFCGSWDAVKGVTYLAAAFTELVDRGAVLEPSGTPVTLTILGGGVPADRIRAAFAPHVQPFVAVVDRTGEEDVIVAYQTHDVLAFPSTYEGFGMVAIEAMSQRLPVVATPVGCVPALIRDGENGVVVPPRDPHALAAALERLLADPSLRVSLADMAFQDVRGMTWARTARATIDVYERAIHMRPALAHA